MEFLNPAALYGLLALPLLLVPYLVKGKPRRMVFSSLLLLTGLKSPQRRPWGSLRLPPIFFLQFLALLLLILALSEPVFSVRPSKIAIVLDNSASMQALESDKSRFAIAQEHARNLLSELGASATVDLYLTLPRLEKLAGPALSPAEAATKISSLKPIDLADAPRDYAAFFDQLTRDQNYDRIYFLTDHPVRGQASAVRTATFGHPQGNLAISSFVVSRSSLVNARLQAQIEVTNFSAKDERVKIALKGGGSPISSREIVIPAGRSAQANFEGFPSNAYYEAEIGAKDALPLDNRRFAVPPVTQTLRILGISPRPQALASLRSIPGVHLDTISPADYKNAERSAYGLEIFHFSTPGALPRTPTLFVLPPDNSLVELGKPVARSAISTWREPHILTRYVNFILFRPSYARVLKPRTPGEAIIASPDGPLSFTAEVNGIRHLVLGFDPFPYLGRDNLPVSIFTLNFLDWFFEGARGTIKSTGEALNFGASRSGSLLLTPDGQKLRLGPETTAFPATLYQGIYQLNRGAEKEHFAVNLQVNNESDLREPAAIELAGTGSSKSSASVFYSFWPHLLLATLLLLFAEWFLSLWTATDRTGFRVKRSQSHDL